MSRINGRPRGWTKCPKLQAAYDEGGRGIGKALMWDKSRESYFWSLIRGLGLWPRWYLLCFRTLYIRENPDDYLKYRIWKKNKQRRKKLLDEKAREAKRRTRRHGRMGE